MEKIQSSTAKSSSFKNAHILSEFSKILQNIGSDIENSVQLFDAIGEKDDLFKKFENLITTPSIEPIIDMHNISKGEIYNFVYKSFAKTFAKNKEQFNYIHVGKNSNTELVFFISTKSEEFKEVLAKSEFEYATGDFSEYLNVNFCFLEEDMEQDLLNTEKLTFDA